MENENVKPRDGIEPRVERATRVSPGGLLRERHIQQSPGSFPEQLGIAGSIADHGHSSHRLVGKLTQLKRGVTHSMGTTNNRQELR